RQEHLCQQRRQHCQARPGQPHAQVRHAHLQEPRELRRAGHHIQGPVPGIAHAEPKGEDPRGADRAL
ncbi:hypothetical protein LPJ66_011242, partial [Kickxella alabastrina]